MKKQPRTRPNDDEQHDDRSAAGGAARTCVAGCAAARRKGRLHDAAAAARSRAPNGSNAKRGIPLGGEPQAPLALEERERPRRPNPRPAARSTAAARPRARDGRRPPAGPSAYGRCVNSGLHVVLRLQAVLHDLELQRADGREDRFDPRLSVRIEHLNRALFAQLGEPLLERLVARRCRYCAPARNVPARRPGSSRTGRRAPSASVSPIANGRGWPARRRRRRTRRRSTRDRWRTASSRASAARPSRCARCARSCRARNGPSRCGRRRRGRGGADPCSLGS